MTTENEIPKGCEGCEFLADTSQTWGLVDIGCTREDDKCIGTIRTMIKELEKKRDGLEDAMDEESPEDIVPGYAENINLQLDSLDDEISVAYEELRKLKDNHYIGR